jgi:hypothetical protein
VGLLLQSLQVRVAVAGETPTRQSAGTDRVERVAFHGRLDLGWRLRGRRLWAQPFVGGALVLSRVEALDLPQQPSQVRVQGAAALGFDAATHLSEAVSLRLELVTMLFPSTDRYVIDQVGVVAQSPRVTFMSSLGLQFDHFW